MKLIDQHFDTIVSLVANKATYNDGRVILEPNTDCKITKTGWVIYIEYNAKLVYEWRMRQIDGDSTYLGAETLTALIEWAIWYGWLTKREKQAEHRITTLEMPRSSGHSFLTPGELRTLTDAGKKHREAIIVEQKMKQLQLLANQIAEFRITANAKMREAARCGESRCHVSINESCPLATIHAIIDDMKESGFKATLNSADPNTDRAISLDWN